MKKLPIVIEFLTYQEIKFAEDLFKHLIPDVKSFEITCNGMEFAYLACYYVGTKPTEKTVLKLLAPFIKY
jgi:hypothetical protein